MRYGSSRGTRRLSGIHEAVPLKVNNVLEGVVLDRCVALLGKILSLKCTGKISANTRALNMRLWSTCRPDNLPGVAGISNFGREPATYAMTFPSVTKSF
ncbi:UNVERIFIED_CONTAM: hypothetical protein PYX00_005757 [Menopon gallinae]|uniref:Uncharacterized protein n=1 Tax=Menopon gallinae TaxID=328185 RepID=A0AAW2HSU2_9NEOP